MRSKPNTTLSLFAPSAVSQAAESPLALRMTPRTLEEWAGQSELLGEGKLLRRAVEADRLSSAIFFGPPGCGKSALARLIAKKTQAAVEEMNAVTAGVADVRAVIGRAQDPRSLGPQETPFNLAGNYRFKH